MTETYYSAMCMNPDGADLKGCSGWAKSDLLRIAVDAFFWIAVAVPQVSPDWLNSLVAISHPQQQSPASVLSERS